MGNRASKTDTVSVNRTISDAVKIYRSLMRIGALEVEALCEKIKYRLRNEPVNEVDVQSIWALQFPDWIDAVMRNIVRFNVLNMQPAGGYIDLFIEAELLQYHDRGAARVVDMYERHKQYPRNEPDARASKSLREALNKITWEGVGKAKDVDRGTDMLLRLSRK